MSVIAPEASYTVGALCGPAASMAAGRWVYPNERIFTPSHTHNPPPSQNEKYMRLPDTSI